MTDELTNAELEEIIIGSREHMRLLHKQIRVVDAVLTKLKEAHAAQYKRLIRADEALALRTKVQIVVPKSRLKDPFKELQRILELLSPEEREEVLSEHGN